MRVEDLNKDQLHEFKESYLAQLDDSGKLQEVAGLESLSYDALAHADDYVSDEVVFDHYAGVEFSEEDFSIGENSIDQLDITPENLVEYGHYDCIDDAKEDLGIE